MQLLEGEIKMLCVKARDIFMQQPILLELEAPIKICGELLYCATMQKHTVFPTRVPQEGVRYFFSALDVSAVASTKNNTDDTPQ